jgi:predicted RNA methylase
MFNKEKIKKITPIFLRDCYHTMKDKFLSLKYYFLRRNIIEHLANEDPLSSEKQEILTYLRSHKLSIFPYDFCDSYKQEDVKVFYDKQIKMNYVLLFGDKRLYLKKGWPPKKVSKYINSLKIEQDKLSPHCYLSDDFCVEKECIVADLGAAEGFFALSVIDLAKKIYLFEPDAEWVEALKMTFAPWKEKIEIIPKYISDTNRLRTVTLDDFFIHKMPPTFIKADIEGCENQLLAGCERIINTSSHLQFALCTYHKQNDYEAFSRFFNNKGFHVHTSHGFMIYYLDNKFRTPYLRRGVIRAWK